LLSAPLTAAAFGETSRRHWRLDVTCREDGCRARVGHAAQNRAVLRPLACNLPRQERGYPGRLPTKRFKASLHADYLAQSLTPLADHLATVHQGSSANSVQQDREEG